MVSEQVARKASIARDDRILPATRIIMVLVVPVLAFAFIILYLFPERSGQNFAWEIKPNMTAIWMGAGYLGGGYLLAHAAFGRRWHAAAAGFPPVAVFTAAMLLATVLHWERFDPNHFPFQLWLVLYAVTPFLIPFLWLRNRMTDPGEIGTGDRTVPGIASLAMRLFGVAASTAAIFMFVFPGTAVSIWPWTLTPLTARILGGWFALLGVGGLVIAADRRWSAWRAPLQSIMLWAGLVGVGALLNLSDFGTAGLLNPFIIGTWLSFLLLLGFHVYMSMKPA